MNSSKKKKKILLHLSRLWVSPSNQCPLDTTFGLRFDNPLKQDSILIFFFRETDWLWKWEGWLNWKQIKAGLGFYPDWIIRLLVSLLSPRCPTNQSAAEAVSGHRCFQRDWSVVNEAEQILKWIEAESKPEVTLPRMEHLFIRWRSCQWLYLRPIKPLADRCWEGSWAVKRTHTQVKDEWICWETGLRAESRRCYMFMILINSIRKINKYLVVSSPGNITMLFWL